MTRNVWLVFSTPRPSIFAEHEPCKSLLLPGRATPSTRGHFAFGPWRRGARSIGALRCPLATSAAPSPAWIFFQDSAPGQRVFTENIGGRVRLPSALGWFASRFWRRSTGSSPARRTRFLATTTGARPQSRCKAWKFQERLPFAFRASTAASTWRRG